MSGESVEGILVDPNPDPVVARFNEALRERLEEIVGLPTAEAAPRAQEIVAEVLAEHPEAAALVLQAARDDALFDGAVGALDFGEAVRALDRRVAAETGAPADVLGYTWENVGDDRVRPEHAHPERYASKLRRERCAPLELTKRGRVLVDRRAEMDRRKARKREGVPKGPANCDGRTRGAFGRLVV